MNIGVVSKGSVLKAVTKVSESLDISNKEALGLLEEELGVESGSLLEASGLVVEKKATNGRAFTVTINGKKYSYFPTEESGLSAKELGQKYEAIAKHSAGKALAWLKKNATTEDSYAHGAKVPRD